MNMTPGEQGEAGGGANKNEGGDELGDMHPTSLLMDRLLRRIRAT